MPLDAARPRAYAPGMRLALLASVLLAACSDDGPGDALVGSWSATWTCETGCGLAMTSWPVLVGGEAFDAVSDAIVWSTQPTIESVAVREADCLHVARDSVSTFGWSQDEFDACAVDGAIGTSVGFHRSAGEIQMRWTLSAVRE